MVLLDNAKEAIEKHHDSTSKIAKGRITIAFHEEFVDKFCAKRGLNIGHYFHISLHDNGSGIPTEIKQKIFVTIQHPS